MVGNGLMAQDLGDPVTGTLDPLARFSHGEIYAKEHGSEMGPSRHHWVWATQPRQGLDSEA